MLTRIIYNGKVYYKVGDLRDLFELSPYKMKKILEKQNIKTAKLNGFGRTLFILQENASKIEVNNEITIFKTVFFTSQKKQTVKNSDETAIENNEKISEVDNEIELDTEQIEELQKEHAELVKLGKGYGAVFLRTNQFHIVDEICEKHLGVYIKFTETTLDDIEKVRLIVSELKAEFIKLDKSLLKSS
ncbi:hypothetical protein [Bacillus sp. RC51]|uniref:hypothetical protein n=1 Tax=Bacillus sp. RC51 TaxID=3156288 RepID=UPI003837C796